MKKVKSTQSIAFSRYPPQRRNDIWNLIYAWSRPGTLGKLDFDDISDPRFFPHCQEFLHRYIRQCGSALGKFSQRRKLCPFAYRNSFFWFLLVSFSVGVWEHSGECPSRPTQSLDLFVDVRNRGHWIPWERVILDYIRWQTDTLSSYTIHRACHVGYYL